MARLAREGADHPDILEFVSVCEVGNAHSVLCCLDSRIRQAFWYRDEIQELIRTPAHMMEDFTDRGILEGDCDDIATFSAACSIALGLRSMLVAIRTDPNDLNYRHVFTETWDGQQWFRLDATVAPTTEMIYYGARMEQAV